MKLPKRTFYYKPKKKPSDEALIDCMEQICLDFPKQGYRRLSQQLHCRGWRINHMKALRMMREKGRLCLPRKKKMDLHH